MNRGQHPVEIARSIKLPLSLQKVPFLQSFYGTPEWSSRAIFDAYVGWYSGTPEEMFPLTPTERGTKMVEAFRADTVSSD
jgi:alkyl sulfatase BDS1-like metallo-beta-lactamase superfamily hydrolase